MFTGITASNGLNSTRLADIRNKGCFTCVKDGLYRISASLMTNTASGQVSLYKNNSAINYLYLGDSTGSGPSHTTFDTLVRLSQGDTISLKAGTKLYVYGNQNTVLSVLQITK